MKRLIVGKITVIGLVAFVISVGQSFAQSELTYDELIGRLVDMQDPAVLPLEGETCKQWSSWDRESQYDTATGKYVLWSANRDGNGCIRQEGGKMVLAEMDGPGCIWRVWSALAVDGHVKIYLDGSAEPAVDLPFRNYFSGDTAPFDYPSLSYDLATHGCRGHNLYYPIPYQKSCKIVGDPEWGRYYQFVYTTFPEGTRVPTFSVALAQEHAAQLKTVDKALEERLSGDPAAWPQTPDVETASIRVAGGRSVCAAQLDGARAIASIQAKIELGDREDEMAALRELCIQITFDGQDQPAVWCPLGDFFGTAPGKNLYASWPTGMTDAGFYAHWYMPFASSARVELVNDGETTRDVRLRISHQPLDEPFEKTGHFHCKWHRDVHQLSEDRWPDWVMLRTQGRGRFLGVMLHVWNPHGGWWGEGDEKFFVDGERFPSTFGTGSEDYFGYAWCHPGLFQRAFHCQTMTMGNKGHQSVLRWQVADAVPFHKSFEACIEKYYNSAEKGTEYACVACWYLEPGGDDPYKAVPITERHGYYDVPPLVAGGFRVLGDPPGIIRSQTLTAAWTNADHLVWLRGRIGAKLLLALPVEETGNYDVNGIFTMGPGFGTVQLSIDGQNIGEPIDLSNPRIKRSDSIPLGMCELAEGERTLGVEIVDVTPNPTTGALFGLDDIVLKKRD